MYELSDAAGEQNDATGHDPERHSQSAGGGLRGHIAIANRGDRGDIVIKEGNDFGDFARLKLPDEFGGDRVVQCKCQQQCPPRQPRKLCVKGFQQV